MQVRSSSLSSELLPASLSPVVTQVRGRYVDWRMLRDVKRRRLVKEFAPNKTTSERCEKKHNSAS